MYTHLRVTFADDRDAQDFTADPAAGDWITVNMSGAGEHGAATARVLATTTAPSPADLTPGAAAGSGPGTSHDGLGRRTIEVNLGLAHVFVHEISDRGVVFSGFTAIEHDPRNSLPDRSYPAGVRAIVHLTH